MYSLTDSDPRAPPLEDLFLQPKCRVSNKRMISEYEKVMPIRNIQRLILIDKRKWIMRNYVKISAFLVIVNAIFPRVLKLTDRNRRTKEVFIDIRQHDAKKT